MKPSAAALAEVDCGKAVLTYDPVRAVGAGKVATPERVEGARVYLRKWLKDNASEQVDEPAR
eukprot:8161699-Lingulodinium_polyedra.AAC.1